MPGNVLTKIYFDLLQEEALKICRRAGFYDEKYQQQSCRFRLMALAGQGEEKARSRAAPYV
jgi:hypothetical protein